MEEIMDYIFPYTGKTIEDTLKGAFFGASVSTTSTGMAVAFETNDGRVPLQLPAATSIKAGIMTPATMQRISLLEGNLRQMSSTLDARIDALPRIPVGVTMAAGPNAQSYNFADAEGNSLYGISVLTATNNQAGLITPDEKKKLRGVQAVYQARAEKNAFTTTGVPTPGTVGELVFDTARKALLLYVGAVYYTEWGATNDPNGLGGRHSYQNKDTQIAASGKVYAWTGTEWTNVGDGLKAEVMTETAFRRLERDGELAEGVLYLTY